MLYNESRTNINFVETEYILSRENFNHNDDPITDEDNNNDIIIESLSDEDNIILMKIMNLKK